MKNPIYRFVATKDENDRSVWLSTTDDIHIGVTGCWWTLVNNLINRQYVDLVLCRAAVRRATVGGRALPVFMRCFRKSCSRIHLNFTSICISWRNEKVARVIISINKTGKKITIRHAEMELMFGIAASLVVLRWLTNSSVFSTFNLDQLVKICKHG